MTIVSSGELEQNFENLLKAFGRSISSQVSENNFDQYLLMVEKICKNLSASCSLLSKFYFAESKILLRSAFETTILFAELAVNPENYKEYIADSEIDVLKNLNRLCNSGTYAYSVLVKHYYEKISECARKRLSVKGSKNSHIKHPISFSCELQKSIRSHKPFSQKIRKRLDKLSKDNVLSFVELNSSHTFNYDDLSQIAHGHYDKIVRYYCQGFSSEDFSELVHDFFRNAIVFLDIVFKSYAKYLVKRDLPLDWIEEVKKFGIYIGHPKFKEAVVSTYAINEQRNSSDYIFLPRRTEVIVDPKGNYKINEEWH